MSESAEQLKNEDAKTALLAAARAVMARDGAKFSIRAVCDEAGIDRDEFNAHFASKIALMAALVAAPAPVFQQAAPPQVPPTDAIIPVPGSETPAPTDAWLERRLKVFERALTALEAKAEASSREQARAIALLEERLKQAAPAPASAAAAAESAAPPAATAEPVVPATEPDWDEAPAELLQFVQLPPPPPAEADNTPPEQPQQTIVQLPAPPAAEADDMPPEQPEQPEVPEIEVAPETGMVLLMPEAPRTETISREEMAEVLASARQAVRNAAADDTKPKSSSTTRLQWLAAGILGLVALFVCIGLTLGGTARATQTIQAGTGVVHRQLAGNPFNRLAARADSGDVKAQAQLAFAYLRGDGAPGNAAAALRWASEAAAHGDPMAEYLLGTFYQPGQNRGGVKPDAAHAFQLFSAAAAQGNIKAMHNLAIAYAEGLGTAKDEVQAAQWFERAASHGYVDSAFDLAVLYERGLGVRQSLKDALRWYSIAAMAGDRPSADRAAFLRHQVSPEDAVFASNAAASFAPLAPISAANRL